MKERPPYDVVLLLSGGLDSTSVLCRYRKRGLRVLCVTFDYGQTLSVEVKYAEDNAKRYGADFLLIMAIMNWIAPSCALFNGNLPKDRTLEEIADGGTPDTYVPFRNGIMLSYAAAIAEAKGITIIACGGNGLASGNYWDDTEEFRAAMEQAIRNGTAPMDGLEYQVYFPNAKLTKADVVRQGVAAGMAVEFTWSCYANGPFPCGTCDSCVQRSAALEEAAQ